MSKSKGREMRMGEVRWKSGKKGEEKRKEDWYWREKVSKNGERAEGEEQVKMGGSGEEGRKGGEEGRRIGEEGQEWKL